MYRYGTVRTHHNSNSLFYSMNRQRTVPVLVPYRTFFRFFGTIILRSQILIKVASWGNFRCRSYFFCVIPLRTKKYPVQDNPNVRTFFVFLRSKKNKRNWEKKCQYRKSSIWNLLYRKFRKKYYRVITEISTEIPSIPTCSIKSEIICTRYTYDTIRSYA